MGMKRLCLDPTVNGDCKTLGELQPLFCDEGGEKEGDVDRDNDTNIVAASVSSASNLPATRTSLKLLGDVPESLELASSASLSLDLDLLVKENTHF